jgi:pimeloyl-ACP methyl ester carboxylesterase
VPSKLATPLLLALAALALLAAPTAATAKDKTTWLCKPGQKNNPCRVDLTATVQKSDGTSTVERRPNAKRPRIDCFYVYPTVSDQKTINATLRIDPEERSIATYQAARFSQTCKVWAPMYRQITLVGISDRSKITPAAQAKAYGDVARAWREYLAKHNHGRGVVLLGHSQGTYMLRQLIAREIDKRPAVRRRLVSAIILGGDVLVRKGRDTGGDFTNIRACRAATQVGCVVAYSAFGDTPPDDSLFGRVPATARKGLQVLCTNPAALGGGKGTLQPYVPTAPFPGTLGLGVRIFIGELPDVPTPWLRPPGRYDARCTTAGGASFLKVDTLEGARVLTPTPNPAWGYHLGDMNLPLGNLTTLVRKQAAAYARAR